MYAYLSLAVFVLLVLLLKSETQNSSYAKSYFTSTNAVVCLVSYLVLD